MKSKFEAEVAQSFQKTGNSALPRYSLVAPVPLGGTGIWSNADLKVGATRRRL